MNVSDEYYWELIDQAAGEGDAELLIAPLTACPEDVPALWREALVAKEPTTKVARLWEQMESRLPRLCQILRERLQGLALLRIDGVSDSLLYLFADPRERFEYRGRLANSQSTLAARSLPIDFLDFYQIHDGFVLYRREDGGPLPKFLWAEADDLWPEVEWKVAPGDCRLVDVVITFRKNDDRALGFDTSVVPSLPLVLGIDGTMDVLLDVWTAIDDEIVDIFGNPERIPYKTANRLREASRERCDRLIGAARDDKGAWESRFSGAAYYQQWSRLLLECAYLETQVSGVVQKACDLYRDSLAKWCTHLERSTSIAPQGLLDFHALTHALGCEGDAAFLGSVPATMWGDGSLEAHQAYALFALERGELEKGAITVGQLREMTFEGDVSPNRYDEIVCRLLESLSQRDSHAYRQWRERTLGEQPHVDSAYTTWISWDFRIAAFDAVAYRLGLINHVSRPLVLG